MTEKTISLTSFAHSSVTDIRHTIYMDISIKGLHMMSADLFFIIMSGRYLIFAGFCLC